MLNQWYIYNKVFHHEDNQENLIDFSTLDDIKYYTDYQRRTFHKLIKTKSDQIYHGSIYHRKHLIKNDLNKCEKCLNELHQTVVYLQEEHQQSTNQLLKYYFQRFLSDEIPENFVPFFKNDQADSIFIAIPAMYYSITQLVKVALALDTTIHDVFELETTDLYCPF
ncbi:unnamed protein product [Rotaria sp. Silwood2]|nr:unnamed protein product [Rotaria sp. Silwood2]